MTKSEKRKYLDLIAAEQLQEVVDSLQDSIPAAHPAAARLGNLARRFRELEERVEMGTLSKEDISRLRSRVAGGLKDIIREFGPAAESATPEPSAREDQPTFKLNLQEDAPKVAMATPEIGYFGEIDYSGSPTMQATTLKLPKSYGAAYHTCREAIRQAGMQMERGDRDGGQLEASIPGTGTGSYGEKVLCWLKPLDGRTTQIHVVVDSQLPTLAFDFGRNKQKLGILVSYLR